jgi:hypothetical protein
MSAEVSECDTAGPGLVIADGLTGADFGVRDLTEDRTHVIQVTDARSAFCQVTITHLGLVTWEYLPFTGTASDPALITAMIAGILDGEPVPAEPGRWSGPTLAGTVGRMLGTSGLAVGLRGPSVNTEFCEASADVLVTCASRPERGRVILTDYAMVIWECPLAGYPAAVTEEDEEGLAGLAAEEITATMARVLSRVQFPGHPRPLPGRLTAV